MPLRPARDVPQEVMTLLRRQGNGWHVGEHLRLDGPISFARVMNPADGDGNANTRGPKTWASIAGESVNATTSWNDVGPLSDAKPPAQSVIDPDNARILANILGPFTTTPDDCYFMTWVGYGDIREQFPRAPSVTISPYGRQMLVLHGSISDGAESSMDGGSRYAGTPLWWVPRDGAWIVGNDIYSTCVYVAASENVIAEILAAEDLEAYRATADMWIIGEEFADD